MRELSPSDAKRLQAILDELKKRGEIKASFTDPNFPKQCEVLADKSRAQAWQCTRRAGKSTTWAKKCLSRLVNNPNSKALYLALTLDSARGILWDMIEQELDAKKIPHKAHKQPGYFELSNGSSLKLFGVDATYREMKRILGQKFSEVGIDEAGSMTIDMKTLVYQMIWPTLSDLEGSLTLLGTAENIPRTFFEEVTMGKDKTLPWSIHKWTAYENPYMARQWTNTINEFVKNDPNVVNTSWFKTHYLNLWCADDDLLIVKTREYNFAQELPKREWFYVLGVDLGFNDASAFVVLAYHPDEKHIYAVHASKSREMDFTDVANQIKVLKQKYPIYQVVVDGANKQGIEEMRKRHGISMSNAEKQDKATFLRMISDDVTQGHFKILPEATQLSDEWAQLQWKKDSEEEDPRCENHLGDSALYAWRYTINNRQINREIKWTPDEEMINRFREEAQKELEKQKEVRFLY